MYLNNWISEALYLDHSGTEHVHPLRIKRKKFNKNSCWSQYINKTLSRQNLEDDYILHISHDI